MKACLELASRLDTEIPAGEHREWSPKRRLFSMNGNAAEVRQVDWRHDKALRCDLLIGSDVVYWDEVIPFLVKYIK